MAKPRYTMSDGSTMVPESEPEVATSFKEPEVELVPNGSVPDQELKSNQDHEVPPSNTFIQPKITGYRQLSQPEVDLINEGKALAEQVGAWVTKLQVNHPVAVDQRWVSIGATGLQQGFMAVIRGIAQPTSF